MKLGAQYKAKIRATGETDSGKHVQLCSGDVFSVIDYWSTEKVVCAIIQGAVEEPGTQFIAHHLWIRDFAEAIPAVAMGNGEPPCVCESPAMHYADCAWLLWKRSRKS